MSDDSELLYFLPSAGGRPFGVSPDLAKYFLERPNEFVQIPEEQVEGVIESCDLDTISPRLLQRLGLQTPEEYKKWRDVVNAEAQREFGRKLLPKKEIDM